MGRLPSLQYIQNKYTKEIRYGENLCLASRTRTLKKSLFLLTVETKAKRTYDWVPIKGVLPWLVRSGAGTRDFYRALAALVSPVQKIFSSPHAIQIYVAGSRAGPPVSECVSPVETKHRAGPTSPLFISGLTCEAQRVRFESRQLFILKLYGLFKI